MVSLSHVSIPSFQILCHATPFFAFVAVQFTPAPLRVTLTPRTLRRVKGSVFWGKRRRERSGEDIIARVERSGEKEVREVERSVEGRMTGGVADLERELAESIHGTVIAIRQ